LFSETLFIQNLSFDGAALVLSSFSTVFLRGDFVPTKRFAEYISGGTEKPEGSQEVLLRRALPERCREAVRFWTKFYGINDLFCLAIVFCSGLESQVSNGEFSLSGFRAVRSGSCE
jgi:hypothetical protein